MPHTAMQELHLFRTGWHGLPADLGRGSGIARADRACMLCGRCPGDKAHLVLECAALQDLRDDMLTWFQNVLSMQCFMWQENMVIQACSGCHREDEGS